MRSSYVAVQLLPPDGGMPRSKGIHVSSVIRNIAIENGILNPEYVESLDLIDASQEQWWTGLPMRAQILIAMGMAWDEWYLPNLGYVVPHPGEMELDGIYLTPDGESLDMIRVERQNHHVVAIHETKLTSKSTKTVGDLSSQWMWLCQIKAYCKAAGTRLAFLHVLFLCGDYKFPITPQIGPLKDQMTAWRLEFTQEELDENWDIITGYVRHRQLQVAEDAFKDSEEAL